MMKIIPLLATVSTTTTTTASPHSKYLSPPPPALIPLSPKKKSSKLMINDFFLLFLLLLLLLLSLCFECFLLHFFLFLFTFLCDLLCILPVILHPTVKYGLKYAAYTRLGGKNKNNNITSMKTTTQIWEGRGSTTKNRTRTLYTMPHISFEKPAKAESMSQSITAEAIHSYSVTESFNIRHELSKANWYSITGI